MEGLLILIGVICVAAVVFAPVGLLMLSRRVRLLTERVNALEAAAAAPEPAQAGAKNPWNPPASAAQSVTASPRFASLWPAFSLCNTAQSRGC